MIKVRDAVKDDMSAVFELIKELALFENAPEEVVTSVKELQEDGFGPNKVFDCIVATENEEVLGFALFYTGYSTWTGKTLYLEDFLVRADQRKRGIGDLVFNRVVEIAKQRGVRRMDWQVLDWNETAIRFYKKHKADIDTEWYNGRLKFT